MKKISFMLITYITLVSIVYSADYDISIYGDISFTPYTYDFKNSKFLTGGRAKVLFDSVFNDIGFSLHIEDIYFSLNENNNPIFKGAFNSLYVCEYFNYKPFDFFMFQPGTHFVWNRSAYQIDEHGIIAENRFGAGLNMDFVFMTENIDNKILKYMNFSFLNKMALFFITGNNSLQYEYHGNVRMEFVPVIHYIKPYFDTGVTFFSVNNNYFNLSSVVFTWSIGASFGNSFKSDKEKTLEVPKTVLPVVIEEEKEEIPVKSAYYRYLEQLKFGDIIKVKNVFFPKNQTVSGAGVKLLEEISNYLIENSSIIILVTGYAEDDIKSDIQIINIAGVRSTLIRKYFIDKGINPDRIKRSTSALTYNISKGLEPFIEIKILQK